VYPHRAFQARDEDICTPSVDSEGRRQEGDVHANSGQPLFVYIGPLVFAFPHGLFFVVLATSPRFRERIDVGLRSWNKQSGSSWEPELSSWPLNVMMGRGKVRIALTALRQDFG
jgi:hypothetical protein